MLKLTLNNTLTSDPHWEGWNVIQVLRSLRRCICIEQTGHMLFK